MDGYEVKVYFGMEDQVYVAEIVEFAGCAVDGPTPEATLASLRDAKAGWIAAMKQQGHPVPAPRHALAAVRVKRNMADVECGY